jgi:hypothetical protein
VRDPATGTAYLAESRLDTSGRAGELDLATALGRTPDGDVWNPAFFSGFVARPDVAAAGLLTVADVAGTNYADLSALRAALEAARDPVVTASGDRLRFESLSGDNGVYARFDLLPDGIDSGEVGFGTTNVDVNQPLRTALASVPRTQLLHLSVGSDQLRVSTPDSAHVERQVPLPERWVRGLAETPLLARATAPVLELVGPKILAFLGSLPKAPPPGPDRWLAATPTGVRAMSTAVPGALHLPGALRLSAARRVARFATRLTASVSESGTTAWRFDVPGGTVTLMLTAGAWRGFSGEGSLLELLAHPEAEATGRRLLDHLAWEPLVDPVALVTATGLTRPAVDAGLAWLSASGRLGYDLTEAQWFHRELPVDTDLVLRSSPRLRSARTLVDGGGLRPAGPGRWAARGSEGEEYAVRREGERWACTCAWEERHHGTRGPCKHVLAVLLSSS